MKNKSSIIPILISIMLLSFGSKNLFNITAYSKEKQLLKYDYNELSNIRHGLLNVQIWKEQAIDILDKKINSINVSNNGKDHLRKIIEKVLHTGIEEIGNILNEQQGEGNRFEQLFRRKAYNTLFDADAFHQKVPELTTALLDALEDETSKDKIKEFLKNEIGKLIGNNKYKNNAKVKLDEVLSKYDADNIPLCKELIIEKIAKTDGYINRYGAISIACFFACFLLWFITPNQYKSILQFIVLSIFSIFVLSAGLLNPMIDIDARITSLDFDILGETISFGEQAIFFQSKSIFDVVEVLIKEGDINSLGVGVLILLFSIVFPLLKILLSIFVGIRNSMPKNKILDFFVFKSAKWSMADVFIVAIFMSYIGFKTILNSQIESIGQGGNNNINVIATDNTSIQIGFTLFAVFVVGSLFLSGMLKNIITNNKNN